MKRKFQITQYNFLIFYLKRSCPSPPIVMKIIFMWMFGQFPKINSWLNWQSIDTRGQFWGRWTKYKFRVHHLITAKLIFEWANTEWRSPQFLPIEEQTQDVRRKMYPQKFSFFSFFSALHVHNIRTAERKIDITKKLCSIHTQQTVGSFHFRFFLGLNFSPQRNKNQ